MNGRYLRSLVAIVAQLVRGDGSRWVDGLSRAIHRDHRSGLGARALARLPALRLAALIAGATAVTLRAR